MDDTEDTSLKKTKINLRNFSIPIVLLFVVGISYFYESDEISCDNEVVQSIIKDLTLPEIKEEYIMKKLAENNPLGSYGYIMAKNMGKEDGIKGYSDAKAKADLIFESPDFSMSSFMTTQKAEEINKVSCSAYINVNDSQFDIKYDAQLTDDGKEVVVNITSFLE